MANDEALQAGSTGDGVALIRLKLARLGIVAGNETFDSQLESSVREFQREHGLKEDGVVGPKTAAALDNGLGRIAPFGVAIRGTNRSQLTAVKMKLDEALAEAEDVLTMALGLRRGTALTGLTISRTDQGTSVLSFRYGDNVSCYCDPPGICVPCNDHPGCDPGDILSVW